MNKLYLLMGFTLLSTIINAQSLVPNGDFEQYSGCPSDYSQIDSALFWTVPTSFNSSDYYNQCATSSAVSVPTNGAGFQEAHSGNAYAGIYLLYGSETREYIETALTSPLINGNCYHFEMYANLSDFSMYTTDAIGVYFSDTAVTAIPYSNYIPFPAQINNTAGAMLNNESWTLISADYTAHGGESYLVIGNFKDDANSTISVANASGFAYAYSYIDDVLLTPCTGIDELNNDEDINVYPNPFRDKFTVRMNSNLPSEITLYNIYSGKVFQQNFSGSITIDALPLPTGIYFYEVRSKNEIIKKGKIVKE